MRTVLTDPEQNPSSGGPPEQQQAAAPRQESAASGNSLYNEFGLPLPKWHPASAQNTSGTSAAEHAPAEVTASPGASIEPTAATDINEEPIRSSPPAPPTSRTEQFAGATESTESEAESKNWAKSAHAAATHGEVEVLKHRLARAEREVRVTLGLLKGMLCLGVVGVIGAVVFTASRSYATLHDGNIVRVPFQVVDSRGTALLRIDADENNRRFRLFDATGEVAVELGSTPDGGVLSITGQGTGSALLLANADGGQLTVTGKKSTPIAWLGGRQGSGTLAFWDETGRQFACMSPKKQIGSLSVIHSVGRVAPQGPPRVHPAPHSKKATSSGKYGRSAPAKIAAKPKAIRVAAHPPARPHHQEHLPVHPAAVKTVAKPIRVAPVKPASNPKRVTGVIGTAVWGQKPTSGTRVVKIASLPKHSAVATKRMVADHKGVKPPPVKAAGNHHHGKPSAVEVARKPLPGSAAKPVVKAAAAHKVKPASHAHALKVSTGGKRHHHRRHHWRGYRSRYYWRSGGYSPHHWSHTGRRRGRHAWRWHGRGLERRWRLG